MNGPAEILPTGRHQPALHILLALLLTLLIFTIAWGVVQESRERVRQELTSQNTHLLEMVARQVTGEFQHVFTDLLAFTKSDTLTSLLLSGDVTGCRDTPPGQEACLSSAKARTERYFVHYLRSKKIYHKMRVLDRQGQEVVTVRLKEGSTVIGRVANDALSRQSHGQWLQDKKNRSYFQQARELPEGAVYVSDLDFNMEYGLVEQPLLPTIRFATPLYEKDEFLGVLVLSYDARDLKQTLQNFAKQALGLELLNQQGAWIFGGPAGSLLQTLPDQEDLQASQPPKAWSQMIQQPAGSRNWLLTREGLLVFRQFQPFVAAANEPRPMGREDVWIAMVRTSPEEVQALAVSAMHQVMAMAGLVWVVMLAAMFMIYHRHQRQAREERDKAEAGLMQQVLHELQILSLRDMPLAGKIETFLEKLLQLPCLVAAAGGVVMLRQEENTGVSPIIFRKKPDVATPPPCLAGQACTCLADLAGGHVTGEPSCGMLRVPVWLRDGLVAILGIYGPNDLPLQADPQGRIALLLRHAVQILAEILNHDRAYQQIQTLQRAVEQSPASVIITDTSGKITYVNQKFLAVTGYAREEVVGRLPSLLKSGQTPDFVYREMWRELGAGRTWQGELCNRRKDGSLFWESVLISPIRNLSDRTTHFLAVKEDITQKKQEGMERQALERQLRQAQKMEALGHLTGGIAHDFNNILAAIKGFTELAIMRFGQDEAGRLRTYLNNILTASERARDLIAQMLTFSRSQELTVGRVILQPLIKEVVKLMRATLPASISITTSLTDQELAVRADPVQLHQTLMNLCVNARDAMAGKGHLAIAVHVETRGKTCHCSSCHTPFYSQEMIVLTVTDDGAGIDPDNLAKIFQPFFTTKEVGQGTGMGLSVIHGIVHSLRGHILVDSTPGQGTAFQLFFQPDDQKSGAVPVQPVLPPAGEGLTGRILLVDDETPILHFLQEALEGEGLTVTSHASSLAALAWFEADPGRIDLVITDQTMPDMTGVEMVAKMHHHRPRLPVILCSGFSRDVNAENATAKGITHMLTKPIDLAILKRHLRHLLSRPGEGQP